MPLSTSYGSWQKGAINESYYHEQQTQRSYSFQNLPSLLVLSTGSPFGPLPTSFVAGWMSKSRQDPDVPAAPTCVHGAAEKSEVGSDHKGV